MASRPSDIFQVATKVEALDADFINHFQGAHYAYLPACPRAMRVTQTVLYYGLEDIFKMHPLANKMGAKLWRFPKEDEDFSGQSITEFFNENDKPAQPFIYSDQAGRVISRPTYVLSTDLAVWADEEFGRTGKDSLFPKGTRGQLVEANAYLYEAVNLMIYKAIGNDQLKAELHKNYEALNTYLADHDYYLLGQLTETDLRLVNNLLRHELYHLQFQVFDRPLSAYPNLYRYLVNILDCHPFIDESTDYEAIWETHYRSPHNIKKYGYLENPPSLQELFPFRK